MLSRCGRVETLEHRKGSTPLAVWSSEWLARATGFPREKAQFGLHAGGNEYFLPGLKRRL